jgi:hypothetical protein
LLERNGKAAEQLDAIEFEVNLPESVGTAR